MKAVERVREGAATSVVIPSYGFNPTTICNWLKAVAKPGFGARVLIARLPPGRPQTPPRAGERHREKIETQPATFTEAPRLARAFLQPQGVAYIIG